MLTLSDGGEGRGGGGEESQGKNQERQAPEV
jgi:hypothetical protein